MRFDQIWSNLGIFSNLWSWSIHQSSSLSLSSYRKENYPVESCWGMEVDEGDSDGIIPVTDSEVDEMVEDAVENLSLLKRWFKRTTKFLVALSLERYSALSNENLSDCLFPQLARPQVVLQVPGVIFSRWPMSEKRCEHCRATEKINFCAVVSNKEPLSSFYQKSSFAPTTDVPNRIINFQNPLARNLF